jgi:hypothetical protein
MSGLSAPLPPGWTGADSAALAILQQTAAAQTASAAELVAEVDAAVALAATLARLTAGQKLIGALIHALTPEAPATIETEAGRFLAAPVTALPPGDGPVELLIVEAGRRIQALVLPLNPLPDTPLPAPVTLVLVGAKPAPAAPALAAPVVPIETAAQALAAAREMPPVAVREVAVDGVLRAAPAPSLTPTLVHTDLETPWTPSLPTMVSARTAQPPIPSRAPAPAAHVFAPTPIPLGIAPGQVDMPLPLPMVDSPLGPLLALPVDDDALAAQTPLGRLVAQGRALIIDVDADGQSRAHSASIPLPPLPRLPASSRWLWLPPTVHAPISTPPLPAAQVLPERQALAALALNDLAPLLADVRVAPLLEARLPAPGAKLAASTGFLLHALGMKLPRLGLSTESLPPDVQAPLERAASLLSALSPREMTSADTPRETRHAVLPFQVGDALIPLFVHIERDLPQQQDGDGANGEPSGSAVTRFRFDVCFDQLGPIALAGSLLGTRLDVTLRLQTPPDAEFENGCAAVFEAALVSAGLHGQLRVRSAAHSAERAMPAA